MKLFKTYEFEIKTNKTKESVTRLFLIILLITAATGCRSFEVFDELHKNPEINELSSTLTGYHFKHGFWPSKAVWDSLKSTNETLRKFSNVEYESHTDTLKLSVELAYPDHESIFRKIKMKPVIDPSGIFIYNVMGIELQPDIQLETSPSGTKIHGVEQMGIKTKLTAAQKSTVRKWKRRKKN